MGQISMEISQPAGSVLSGNQQTKGFLEHFGLDALRDLPDIEALEDAGLIRTIQGSDRGPMIAVEGEEAE